MKKITLYHPETGEILGQVAMTDHSQVINYPDHIELDDEDYESKTDGWAVVDVVKKTLHPRPGKIDPTGKGRTVKRE